MSVAVILGGKDFAVGAHQEIRKLQTIAAGREGGDGNSKVAGPSPFPPDHIPMRYLLACGSEDASVAQAAKRVHWSERNPATLAENTIVPLENQPLAIGEDKTSGERAQRLRRRGRSGEPLRRADFHVIPQDRHEFPFATEQVVGAVDFQNGLDSAKRDSFFQCDFRAIAAQEEAGFLAPCENSGLGFNHAVDGGHRKGKELFKGSQSHMPLLDAMPEGGRVGSMNGCTFSSGAGHKEHLPIRHGA